MSRICLNNGTHRHQRRPRSGSTLLKRSKKHKKGGSLIERKKRNTSIIAMVSKERKRGGSLIEMGSISKERKKRRNSIIAMGSISKVQEKKPTKRDTDNFMPTKKMRSRRWKAMPNLLGDNSTADAYDKFLKVRPRKNGWCEVLTLTKFVE